MQFYFINVKYESSGYLVNHHCRHFEIKIAFFLSIFSCIRCWWRRHLDFHQIIAGEWLQTDKENERDREREKEAQTSRENMRNWYKVNHEQRTMNFVFSGLWTEKRGTINNFISRKFLWRCQQIESRQSLTFENQLSDQTTTIRMNVYVPLCVYLFERCIDSFSLRFDILLLDSIHIFEHFSLSLNLSFSACWSFLGILILIQFVLDIF